VDSRDQQISDQLQSMPFLRVGQGGLESKRKRSDLKHLRREKDFGG
jgi:hypothetical protein